MRLAIHLPNFTLPGGTQALAPALAATARAAEDGGCATLTVMDHYFQMEQMGGPAEPMLFPSTSERYERLEETLQICRQMWSEDDGPYDGSTTSWPRPSACRSRSAGRGC